MSFDTGSAYYTACTLKYRGTSSSLLSYIFQFLCLCGIFFSICAPVFSGIVGVSIDNQATATYSLPSISSAQLNITSNTVSATTTIQPTNAVIRYYQHTTSGDEEFNVPIPTFSLGQPMSSNAFTYPQLNLLNQLSPLQFPTSVIDPQSNNVPIKPLETFQIGDPLFILLEDGDQNVNDAIGLTFIRESVTVTLSTPSGAQLELTLAEVAQPAARASPDFDTGLFAGYVPTWNTRLLGPAPNEYQVFLELEPGDAVTVSYDDVLTLVGPRAFRQTELETYRPSRVFNSLNGDPFGESIVRLLHGPESAPQPVLCSDVFAENGDPYFVAEPTICPSASSVFPDIITNTQGEFTLPYIDFTNTNGYLLQVFHDTARPGPSLLETNLTLLPEGFQTDAILSFEKNYTNANFLPQSFDIPKDPAVVDLVLEKKAQVKQAGIGDFIQYSIDISNRTSLFSTFGVVISDVLPKGFRYVAGTAVVDEVSMEPEISPDGRQLFFSLDQLAASTTTSIRYVLTVGAGAEMGLAINTAQATDSLGNQSNQAEAAVTIIDDLMRTKNFIMGRVMLGGCEVDHEYSIRMKQKKVDNRLDLMVIAEGGIGAVDEAHIVLTLPKKMRYIKDSARLNNKYLPISTVGDTLLFSLGQLEGQWQREVTFSVDILPGQAQELDILAQLNLKLDTINLQTDSIQTGIQRKESQTEVVKHVFKTRFNSFSEQIPGLNKKALQEALPILNSDNIKDIKIIGHSDNQKIRARNQHLFPDNKALSTARAQSIAESIIEHFPENAEKLTVEGQGASNPISSNNNKAGRENNRRVEFVVEEWQEIEREDFIETNSESEKISVLYSENSEKYGIANTGTQLPGVENVRVLLEDGSYVLTDKEGKFHFTGLQPQTHVVQVDIESLPDDMEIFACEKNTRFAGTPYSRFVDAQAGSLWRTDFYVRKKNNPPNTSPEPQDAVHENTVEYQTFQDYDQAWLDQAAPGIEMVYPKPNFSPSAPSVDFVIKHAPKEKVVGSVNGQTIDGRHFMGLKSSASRTTSASRWLGVHLVGGENIFEFNIYDKQQRLIQQLTKVIHYVETIDRIELAPAHSQLIADGKTNPSIALKLLNYDGHPVRKGLQGTFSVKPPYVAKQALEELKSNPLNITPTLLQYTVGNEGIAIIELEPTTQSGSVTLTMTTTGQSKTLDVWLQPDARDWILVGLAEGTAAYNEVKENMVRHDHEEGYYQEGRLAFYAKGKIKAEWLLTLAYDSSREKEGENFQGQIDPGLYFTLYGDATQRYFDAPSRERLYMKIERGHFYTLFGDFATGLTQTELGRYSRSLTGVKTEFQGQNFSVNAFAAKEEFNFVKDEIQGDGTSGLYRLSQDNIVISGERIMLQTRDRFQNEKIISETILSRFLDYEIDYVAGTLLFKQPIFSRDNDFNPIYIVAEYETLAPATGEITLGGRAAYNTENDSLIIGATYISDKTPEQFGKLSAIDATVKVTQNTTAKIELADSKNTDSPDRGKAYLAEIEQISGKQRSRVYVRNQESDFGLGQQSVSTGNIHKIGAETIVTVSDRIALEGEAYQEKQIDSATQNAIVEARALYRGNDYSLDAGLRSTRDLAPDQVLESTQLLLGASKSVIDNKLRVRLNTESSVQESDSISHPDRYILGADYHVNNTLTLFSEYEFSENQQKETQAARIGARTRPWRNAQINTSFNETVQENVSRTFANFGLVQNIPLNDRWAMDFGLDSSRTLEKNGLLLDTEAPLNLEADNTQDFLSFSIGTSYRADTWSATKRLEWRDSEESDRLGALLGWKRQLQNGIAYSARLQAFDTVRDNANEELNLETSASLAYRPIASNWIILDRLQYKMDSSDDTVNPLEIKKWINNIKINYLPDRQNQWALSHGIKYVKDVIEDQTLSGLTQFLGLEYRHDLSPKWDVGMHMSGLFSHEINNLRYGYGINTGRHLRRNLWFSVGYNFEGFKDEDFDSANYRAKGPWLKLRFKFDQDTLRNFNFK